MQFTIPGRLPGLNEVTNQNRRHWSFGARLKKTATNMCASWAVAGRIPEYKTPIKVHVKWYEPNRRRDRDNVESGVKFILDGLKLAHKIKDDSQKWIVGVSHEVLLDRQNPRIEVTID